MVKELEGYRNLVEEGLKGVLNEREKGDPLYHPIRHMLGIGGKRMRPVALLIACEIFGGDRQDALHPALGLELFHNFTLMHDDLMDEAPLRRGHRTVHELYGRDMAVLSGDAMFVKAYQEMSKVPDGAIRPVSEDFNRVALEVCEGQRMDMEFEEREDVSVDEYLRMIASKTGALLGGAMRIGSRIGDAHEEELDRMEGIGRKLGVAFQLQDDLMDVYAEGEKFGKRRGGDICSGKKTFLLIRAFEKADHPQKERLERALNLTEEEAKVNEVVALYDELGIPGESKERSEGLFEEAQKAIEVLKGDKERIGALEQFVEKLRNRES